MFGRLHKQKSNRNSETERERFDIELSCFKALQIPKGWDRLELSLVSVESGKTLNKTARAVVWNGNCQRTKKISQSVWMTRDDATKYTDGRLLKIVVTSGSSRSNVLGEASINLGNYVEASVSVPVSMQLNECGYRTILQMKVRNLSSKPKLREEQAGSTDLNASYEELTIEYDEQDRRSDGSEITSFILPRNFMSSPSQLRKSNTKETSMSFSPSVSGGSFDSWEENISDKDISCKYSSGRQNWGGSLASLANINGTINVSSKQRGSSGRSFQNQNEELNQLLPLRNAGSSKELIEPVEVMVEELRAEARMWEQNARKLMSDMEILREEMSEQSERGEILGSELAASQEVCESLRQENKRINVILEDLMRKQTANENGAEEFRESLEEEIKFQEERNADLASQLRKTHDSNVELLSVLQEFEETIDAQKAEIDALFSAKQIEGSAVDSRISELEDEIREKEMMASSETAALKLQLDRCKEQMELLVPNYALVHLDSALYMLEISQHDRDEDSNSNKRAIPVVNPAFSSLHAEEEISIEDSINNTAEKCPEVDDVRGEDSLKEEEIEALKSRIKELEERILSFEDKKSSASCKCFGGMCTEKTPVDRVDDSTVSVNKFLVTAMRIDSYNHDMEDRLSELEEENVWLSERIIGLEAQLRYLTNEKESTLLSLQNSASLCSKLKNETRKLESDMEVMGIDTKQKLVAVWEQLSQSLDERGRLKVANSKLQDDSKVLIEKYKLLEKANEELKNENVELHEERTVLEAEVSELRELFLHASTEIEVLEGNFASLMEETTLKEKALRSEVDTLLRENERINENIPEDSVRSSDTKTMAEVAISEHNEEVLMAEREKLLDLLEDVKAKEKQLKSTVRRLHIMLKGSEYENRRLVGEIKSHELRLQQTESLRKEVSALRRGIGEAIFAKERLEASNQVLLEQYKETESERESLLRKISSVQRALTEVEHSRNTKAALEEKILRLEGDLTAREALFAHNAEQRNELARMRIANTELRRKIKCLEDENKEYRARFQLQKPEKENGVPSEYENRQDLRSLERELVDLRESYSAMSLKYAQAEAHREQLLMRLKAN